MDYSFVAFQDFRDDDEAYMIFKTMDKNSHGIVLFKEWFPRCFHLPHPVEIL